MPALTSRRSFLSVSAAASTALAMRIVTEPILARAAMKSHPADAVMIDANENPLGPCTAARAAITNIIPEGGRYHDDLSQQLTATIARLENLKTEQVAVFAGSSPALHYAVRAFASPARSYVTADPGYEAGMFAAETVKAKVVKVPLTKDYAHDVKAMIAAAADAGMFYVCTPNNPTGTLTSHSDIEYLVANKPAGSIVVVDEAYIHFSDGTSALDLVRAAKDVVVLRTFSKIYGMAGLRCGIAMARPDLLEKISSHGGWNALPIPAVVAAQASLNDAALVSERKQVNARIRSEVFAWLDSKGYAYVPSVTNFFMLDAKRPGRQLIDAMAHEKIMIGRIWPAWPTFARITVGTRGEMDEFQSALQKVMLGAVAYGFSPRPLRSRNFADGLNLPV
jgi:histidinol-phosphate aminotransferase